MASLKIAVLMLVIQASMIAASRSFVDVTNMCIQPFMGATVEHVQVVQWLADEVNSRFPTPHSIGSHDQPTFKPFWHIQTSPKSLDFSCSAKANVLQMNLIDEVQDEGSFSLELQQDSFRQRSSTEVIVMNATDLTGMRSAVGRLLRELRMPPRGGSFVENNVIRMPGNLFINYTTASALWKVRGHQIAASHHPLQFRSSSELVQFTKDLSVFGTNQLEVAHIANHLDIDGLVSYSHALATAGGVAVSVWADVATFTLNTTLSQEVFSKMPRLDSLFFPGGDGGTLDWDDIEQTSKLLKKSHTHAAVWVSAQELSSDDMVTFWKNVSKAIKSGFLTGVVYGPHVRYPLSEFVKRAQEVGAPVRQYPDITHTLSDQFPIPAWHSAWSLTHGRQAVSPMPQWSSRILTLRANGSTPTIGVGAYSEGIGDDLNKVIWSAMAEDSILTVENVTRQYARFFFGAEVEDDWTAALIGLEKNWQGAPDKDNDVIKQTLSTLKKATANGVGEKDWRSQMYLKRGYYDAFVQARYEVEVEGCEEHAYDSLKSAQRVGSLKALEQAGSFLQNCTMSQAAHDLKAQVLSLTGALNASVGAEVIGNQDTSLNTKTMMTPISDATFLINAITSIQRLSSDQQRLDAINSLVNWETPEPGGYYDNLANKELSPHLVPGQGYEADPSFFYTPAIAYPTAGSVDFKTKLTWSSYAMSFFDAPTVTLRYPNLDPSKQYKVRVVFYAGHESSREPSVHSVDGTSPIQSGPSLIRLVANENISVWPPAPLNYSLPPTPMVVTDIMIPRAATAQGTLTLSCNQPPGVRGNGRTCEICEVWLNVQ